MSRIWLSDWEKRRRLKWIAGGALGLVMVGGLASIPFLKRAPKAVSEAIEQATLNAPEAPSAWRGDLDYNALDARLRAMAADKTMEGLAVAVVENGRLSAVIDFGTSGVGDPACDLAITWTFLHGESRETFRRAIAVDEGTWARGRGWTIWKSLIVLADQIDSDPVGAAENERIIADVIAEV